jgi:hypothetical protein
MSGLPYGEGQQYRTQQRSAPMAAAVQPADVAPAAVPQGPPIVGPGSASQRPNEPVTAGAPLGPGPAGLVAVQPGAPAASGQISRALRQIAASDPTGTLAALAIEAERRGQ